MRLARKAVIAVVGGTVVLVGIAMIVLSGPAVLIIPPGLAILGTEFYRAKHWLKRARALLPNRNKAPPASIAGQGRHQLPTREALAMPGTAAPGLSAEGKARRLVVHGPNEPQEGPQSAGGASTT